MAITALNYFGVKLTTNWMGVLSTVAALLLVGYAIVIWPAVDLKNLEPLPGFGPLGAVGGAGTVFFAYSGFERAALIVSEIRIPEKTIPRSIFLSFPVSAAAFLLVGVATLGCLSAQGAIETETHHRNTCADPSQKSSFVCE